MPGLSALVATARAVGAGAPVQRLLFNAWHRVLAALAVAARPVAARPHLVAAAACNHAICWVGGVVGCYSGRRSRCHRRTPGQRYARARCSVYCALSSYVEPASAANLDPGSWLMQS